MSRRLLTAALLLLLAVPATLRAQPAVSHLSPGAVAPGQTAELTLVGTKLEDPLAVWTSFPATIERLPVEATQRKIKVTVPADVPLGIHGIVVGNYGGVAPPLFVMLDDLPSLPEAAANNALATPQDLTPPIAVDGASNGQQSDFYRLTLAQNQKVSIEVVATRLGFDFDSVLRVLDATGRELALADDDEAVGADARLVFTAPAAGQYLLELRDNRFKPGGRYRFRIGDFPLVSCAYPAGGTTGASFSTSLVTIEGTLLPATVRGAGGRLTPLFASAKRPEGGTGGFARIERSHLPTTVEIEAASHAPSGQPFATPLAINGRLSEPKQRDRFAFAARKGERSNFQATSRRFGSPAVIAMRVLNAADAQVAASAPTESEEELLAFTAPEDGVYRLEVEDLLGRGGPAFVYRLEATPGSLFNLGAKSDPATRFQHALSPGGGAFLFDVQVQRSGYDGPVQLSVACERAGFRIFPSTIGEKVNELRTYVFPPADFHAGELVDLRIVGTANVGPAEHRTVARNLVQLKAARPFLPHPPAWLEGSVFAGYADQAAFYTAAPTAAELAVPLGGQAMVPFAFARTDANFKDVPLALTFYGLPAGLTTEVKRSAPGPTETYEATFKAAANAPEGRHAVHWLGYVEYQGRGRAVEGDLTLVVSKPAP